MVKRVKNEALKLALERNAILVAELAKVESRLARGDDPAVKSRRKQNKKQVDLKVEQFISKTKPKDQLTERLQGARIKLALDNQYNKLISEAQGKRKADISKIATESQDVKLDKAHIEGKKQEKLLLLKANEDVKQDAKDARNKLLMDKLQSIEDKLVTPDIVVGRRGRPAASVARLEPLLDSQGDYDASMSDLSLPEIKQRALDAGISTYGKKKKDLAQELVNLQSADTLFKDMEESVNEPRTSPYKASKPKLLFLDAIKLKPKLIDSSSQAQKEELRQQESIAEQLKQDKLNIQPSLPPTRRMNSYKVETKQSLLEELNARNIEIPANADKTVLFDLLKTVNAKFPV